MNLDERMKLIGSMKEKRERLDFLYKKLEWSLMIHALWPEGKGKWDRVGQLPMGRIKRMYEKHRHQQYQRIMDGEQPAIILRNSKTGEQWGFLFSDLSEDLQNYLMNLKD
tara:strand:- start:383 stop:712 length:330 start_codon:yes stop_codon:yes gene_type:complete